MAFTSNLRKIVKSKNSQTKPDNKFSAENWLFIIPLSILFVGWELTLRLNLTLVDKLPLPSEILSVLFFNLLYNPEFILSVFKSLANLMAGIFLASLIAIPMAIVAGLKNKMDSSLTPLIMIVGALPDVALLPFFVYWFGRGAVAAIIMATVVAFFPLFFTVREGIKNIPKDYFHVAYVYKAKKIDVYTKLVLPAIYPQLITGIRLAYEFLWEIVLAIEIIASISGIGFIINFAVEEGSLAYAFAGIFMIGIIAILIDRLIFNRLEEKIKRWHE